MKASKPYRDCSMQRERTGYWIICPLLTFLKLTFTKMQKKSNFFFDSWHLNNLGVRDTIPPCSQNSRYNFWLLQNLTTNSLLLTGSFTDNTVDLTHILYKYYILYSYKKLEENIFKNILRKRNTFIILYWKIFMYKWTWAIHTRLRVNFTLHYYFCRLIKLKSVPKNPVICELQWSNI